MIGKKRKVEAEITLRSPKAKKLGLKVCPIKMPHEDLIKPEIPQLKLITQEIYQSNTELATLPDSSLLNQGVASSLATPTPSVASSLATLETKKSTQLATHSTQELATLKEKTQIKRPNQKLSYETRKLVTVAIRLKTDLNKEINDFCHKYNIEKQDFFQSVASYTLELSEENLAKIFTKTVASWLATHDDKMISMNIHGYIPNTIDDIINAHAQYARARWTRRDDRDGAKYNKIDLRLIEIAMISTIERKLYGNTSKIPVKSFSYFTTEIDRLVEQSENNELPNNLEDYYKYVMNSWETRIKPLRDTKWKNR